MKRIMLSMGPWIAVLICIISAGEIPLRYRESEIYLFQSLILILKIKYIVFHWI